MTPDRLAAMELRQADSAPEGWRSVRLGDLFEQIIDTGHSEDLPVLSVTLDRGVVRRTSLDRKSEREVGRTQYLRARPGDIAYNTMRMWQGGSGLVREEGYLSPAYTVCRARSGEDPEFWAFAFKSEAMISAFRAHSQGFAKDRYRLYFKHFSVVPALRPPLSEQGKIAAILSTADETLEKTNAIIEGLQTLLKAMMRELLKGRPGRAPNFKDAEIGEIPASWRVRRLLECGDLLSGGTPSKQNPSFWSGSIPWISPKDMKTSRILDSIDHVSESAIGNGTKLVPASTILMVVRGMILAHSFPVTLTLSPVAFNQDIKALVPNNDFDPEFLLYWLTNQKECVLSWSSASSHGTRTVPTEPLLNLPVSQPPLAEQKHLSSVLHSAENSIEANRVELRALEWLRRVLGNALLTGKIRVTPDEVPS